VLELVKHDDLKVFLKEKAKNNEKVYAHFFKKNQET
jgi:hypothetical protein